MRKLFLVFMLFGGIVFEGKCELLKDYEKNFDKIMNNFSTAANADKNSRMRKDFEKKLAKLLVDARVLQAVITKLEIEDINLPKQTMLLQELFYNMRKGKNVGDRTNRWNPGFKIRKYLRDLNEMGFSYEKKSIAKRLEKKPALVEFRDILNHYARNIKIRFDDEKRTSWRTDFEGKLKKFQVLGKQIQEKLNKKGIDVNITSDMLFLVQAYKKTARLTKNKETLELDVEFTIRELRDKINKLSDMGFSVEGKKDTAESSVKTVGKNTEKDIGGGDAGEASEENAVEDYKSMSRNELFKILQEERDRIYKSDNQMDGISPTVISEYVKTLTKSQKAHYKRILERYARRRYDSAHAKSMALQEIHGYYRNRPKAHSKKEMVSILKKLDDIKEKNKNKDNPPDWVKERNKRKL